MYALELTERLGHVTSSSGAGTLQSLKPSRLSASQCLAASLLVISAVDAAFSQTRQVFLSNSELQPTTTVPVPGVPGRATRRSAPAARACTTAAIAPSHAARSNGAPSGSGSAHARARAATGHVRARRDVVGAASRRSDDKCEQ